MSETRKRAHTEIIKVRWGDMDAFGHVNNINFFQYMEQARISWFDTLSPTLTDGDEGPVIVSACCTFIKPIVFPATVAVSVEVGELGRSSMPISHEIYLENDPAIRFAEGRTTIVWVNRKSGKSVPLPAQFREFMAR